MLESLRKQHQESKRIFAGNLYCIMRFVQNSICGNNSICSNMVKAANTEVSIKQYVVQTR